MPHSFVALPPEPEAIPFTWQGRTYYARELSRARLEETFRRAAACELMVSAIILIGNPVRDSSPVLATLGQPHASLGPGV